jgi:hypothetical protein
MTGESMKALRQALNLPLSFLNNSTRQIACFQMIKEEDNDFAPKLDGL